MKINPVLYVVIGIVILVGLFLIFKPKSQVPVPQDNSNTTQQVSSPSAQSESNVKTFELVVENKKLVSGPETIKVTQGDQVEIKITADEIEELHIHGYDESVELESNKQATLSFVANTSGRFDFELEKSKTDLGALEVQPK